MKKISLQEKKSHYEKNRLRNYQASMRLEGIMLTGNNTSKHSVAKLSRDEVLAKYRVTK